MRGTASAASGGGLLAAALAMALAGCGASGGDRPLALSTADQFTQPATYPRGRAIDLKPLDAHPVVAFARPPVLFYAKGVDENRPPTFVLFVRTVGALPRNRQGGARGYLTLNGWENNPYLVGQVAGQNRCYETLYDPVDGNGGTPKLFPYRSGRTFVAGYTVAGRQTAAAVSTAAVVPSLSETGDGPLVTQALAQLGCTLHHQPSDF